MKRIILIVLAIALVGCAKGKYLPVKNSMIDIAVPIQQETVSQAIYDAFAKLDPELIKPLHGKTAYVEVATGFNNVEEYIGGVAEWHLAKAGIVVLPAKKEDFKTALVYEYPQKTDYRVLLIVDTVGANIHSYYKTFLSFTWGNRTTYKSICRLHLVVQSLADGLTRSTTLNGESKEIFIDDGYVYKALEG